MKETAAETVPGENHGKRVRVLLIEDEKGLAEEISAELHRLGYAVSHVETVAEGMKAAKTGAVAILIVDRMLHGCDGLSMVETLRKDGVKAGGDDYLVKPFAMAELAARVEALLRRLDDVRTTILRVRDLEMDLVEHTVARRGSAIELLPREFKLLEYFLRRPGQIVTRAMLLEGVWRYRFIPETNVVDVHIGNLRRKIDIAGSPSLITNIRGAGFMLNEDT
jgi:two-component system, OmpR family, response regulator